jgi:hypothetical protein
VCCCIIRVVGYTISKCRACSKEFAVETYLLKWGRGKFCSRPCKDKIPWKMPEDKILRGSKSPSWKGGRSGRYHARNKRPQLEERLGKKCFRCKRTDRRLVVHHVDENILNNKLSNLRLVCYSCHGIIHDTGKHLINVRSPASIRRLPDKECLQCGVIFRPHGAPQKLCSLHCFGMWNMKRRIRSKTGNFI